MLRNKMHRRGFISKCFNNQQYNVKRRQIYVDTTSVDVSIHHIKRTFIFLKYALVNFHLTIVLNCSVIVSRFYINFARTAEGAVT